jgi:hypothetical protein
MYRTALLQSFLYQSATTATLGIAGITAAGSYQYRCYLTNCNGNSNTTSDEVTLTVNATPLTLSLTGDIICESPEETVYYFQHFSGKCFLSVVQFIKWRCANAENRYRVRADMDRAGDAGTGYYVIGTNTSNELCVFSKYSSQHYNKSQPYCSDPDGH